MGFDFEIICSGCYASGRRTDIHSDGWRLAKSRVDEYVCSKMCDDILSERHAKAEAPANG